MANRADTPAKDGNQDEHNAKSNMRPEKTSSSPQGKRRFRAWDGMGEYFSAKRTKMQDQFVELSKEVLDHRRLKGTSALKGKSTDDQDVSTTRPNASVFQNMWVFLAGDHNVPMLVRIILENGGFVEQHPTRVVTHIVSSQLPLNVRQQWVGKTFVNPKWVQICVERGHLSTSARDGYIGKLTTSNWSSIANSKVERSSMRSWLERTVPSNENSLGDKNDNLGMTNTMALRAGEDEEIIQEEEGLQNNEDFFSKEAEDEGVEEGEEEDSETFDDLNEEEVEELEELEEEEEDGEPSSDEDLGSPTNGGRRKPVYNGFSIPSTHSPNFLPTFFSNSRLHHLSTWKQELFQLVRDELPNNNPLPALSSENPVFALARHTCRTVEDEDENSSFLWFHIDMDCFFATASLLERPDLKDVPVVVCHTRSKAKDSTSEIASCNYPARKFGIKNGMFLASALTKCPQLNVLYYNFDLYKSISRKLYEVIIGITHDLKGYCVPCSLDEMYLQIPRSTLLAAYSNKSSQPQNESLGDLYDSGLRLATDIRTRIFSSTGCSCSIGIGLNRFIARIATSLAKPDGVHATPRSRIRDDLIKLDRLDSVVSLGRSKVAQLNSEGIFNIKQLYAVSKDSLMKILGNKLGAQTFDFLRGYDPRPDNSWKQVVNTVSINVNWGIRLEGDKEMCQFVDNYVDQLKKKLELTRNKWAKKMSLCIKVKEPGTKTYKFLGCGICYDCNYTYDISGRDWDYVRASIKSASRKAANTEKATGTVGCLRGYNCSLTQLIPIEKTVQSKPTTTKPTTVNRDIDPEAFQRRDEYTTMRNMSNSVDSRGGSSSSTTEQIEMPTVVLRNLDSAYQTDLDWDWDWKLDRMNIFGKSAGRFKEGVSVEDPTQYNKYGILEGLSLCVSEDQYGSNLTQDFINEEDTDNRAEVKASKVLLANLETQLTKRFRELRSSLNVKPN